MTTSDSVRVSLIAPIYNEYENLPDLVAKVESVMSAQPDTWEFVCVDDGSRDGSDKLLTELAVSRPWLKPYFLRRNYGQSTAMQAGFDAARGDILVTIDGDMQNDPADIPRLLKMLDERPEIDIISGWRKNRQDKALMRKFPSKIANRLISSVTGVRLHDYGCSLKLYRREAVRFVKIYGELHRFIPALAHEYGAKVMETEVNHFPRTKGVSKYGIDRTIRVLLDLMWVKFMLRFLHRPMHAFGGIGAAMFFPGILILFYLAAIKLFGHADIGGRPLLQMGVMLTLMGTNFIGMGILGEMLTRIWHEPGGKAQYLLREPPGKRE
ncbi:glycosyltransferase [Parasulfuritortus cantonensis]|uniref:Glycosyltransferase n=1 Tax=Parasulfuritortus cantonensis TaxID=2528202 RepID=A0A4V2NWS4_9PROT|nr:glycosyltransferase family 2 protein [Parasulfuritortus cantonensis]TCJ18502.1 glycosyltransferase [Parasulfuritortus cantonensis]